MKSTQSRTRRNLRDVPVALVLLVPNLFLLAWFTYRPLVQSIRLSFVRWDLISPDKVNVGFQNYTNWWRDPVSRLALRNTAVFAVSTVGLLLVGGLLFANALNNKHRSSRVASAALFAPYIVPALSSRSVGISSSIRSSVFSRPVCAASGSRHRTGTNRPGWAMAMVVLVHVWKHLGYTCVLFLAGLQAIPPELYEAAKVDGAGWLATFRHVVLPGVKPTTVFVAVTSFLASMQAFDLVYVMTQGGPLDGTRTLSYQIYDEAFVRFRVGTASAVSTVLFVVLLVFTIVQLRVMDRKS